MENSAVEPTTRAHASPASTKENGEKAKRKKEKNREEKNGEDKEKNREEKGGEEEEKRERTKKKNKKKKKNRERRDVNTDEKEKMKEKKMEKAQHAATVLQHVNPADGTPADTLQSSLYASMSPHADTAQRNDFTDALFAHTPPSPLDEVMFHYADMGQRHDDPIDEPCAGYQPALDEMLEDYTVDSLYDDPFDPNLDEEVFHRADTRQPHDDPIGAPYAGNQSPLDEEMLEDYPVDSLYDDPFDQTRDEELFYHSDMRQSHDDLAAARCAGDQSPLDEMLEDDPVDSSYEEDPIDQTLDEEVFHHADMREPHDNLAGALCAGNQSSLDEMLEDDPVDSAYADMSASTLEQMGKRKIPTSKPSSACASPIPEKRSKSTNWIPNEHENQYGDEYQHITTLAEVLSSAIGMPYNANDALDVSHYEDVLTRETHDVACENESSGFEMQHEMSPIGDDVSALSNNRVNDVDSNSDDNDETDLQIKNKERRMKRKHSDQSNGDNAKTKDVQKKKKNMKGKSRMQQVDPSMRPSRVETCPFQYTIQTPLSNLMSWRELITNRGEPASSALIAELVLSAQQRQLASAASLLSESIPVILVTSKVFDNVTVNVQGQGMRSRKEFIDFTDASTGKGMLIDASKRLALSNKTVSSNTNIPGEFEGLMITVNVHKCPADMESEFDASLCAWSKDVNHEVRHRMSKFECWTLARIEEHMDIRVLLARARYNEMVIRCKDIIKMSAFSTYKKAIAGKMLPNIGQVEEEGGSVGRERVPGQGSSWEGAFTFANSPNKRLTRFIIDLFCKDILDGVTIYSRQASILARAFENDEKSVREFFEEFLSMPRSKIRTTALREERSKREEEKIPNWLFGPDRVTGVCEGLTCATGVMETLFEFDNEKFSKEHSDHARLSCLRDLASIVADESTMIGPKKHPLAACDNFVVLFVCEKNARRGMGWIREFLRFGGVAVIADRDIVTWDVALVDSMREMAIQHKCLLRASSKDDPQCALMFYNPNAEYSPGQKPIPVSLDDIRDQPKQKLAKPRATLLAHALSNIKIIDNAKTFVLCFYD